MTFVSSTNVRGECLGFKTIPNFYSLTEFGGLIAFFPTCDKLGYVAPGTKARIADPDTNEILKPGEVGEIQAICSVMTPGYYNRPDEDAKLYTPDGFMKTGDLGHYDEEGVLYFDGRHKELIKSRGLHVHPVEIEEIICKLPGVTEAAVFGRPDEVRPHTHTLYCYHNQSIPSFVIRN